MTDMAERIISQPDVEQHHLVQVVNDASYEEKVLMIAEVIRIAQKDHVVDDDEVAEVHSLTRMMRQEAISHRSAPNSADPVQDVIRAMRESTRQFAEAIQLVEDDEPVDPRFHDELRRANDEVYRRQQQRTREKIASQIPANRSLRILAAIGALIDM